MKHSIWKAALLLALCLILGETAAMAEGTAEINAAADAYTEKLETGFDEKAEQYAPRVTTLANGVQVQRVPTGNDTSYQLLGYDIAYNMYYADAERRGCWACHNLNTLAGNLKGYLHSGFENAMGIETTVQMCIQCHTSHGTLVTEENFDDLMHALHGSRNKAFDAMGGDCWSCHYADIDGKEMALWDNVKHRVMRGITKMSSDTMNGEFRWNQDKVIAGEDTFDWAWIHDLTDVEREGRKQSGLTPDPENDGVYDAWMLTVNGDVENPTTMSINDWIAAIGTEDVVMVQDCDANPAGGPLIANSHVTGLNVQKMVEYCKPIESANSTIARAYTNWRAPDSSTTNYFPQEFTFEDIENYGLYIALEIGGEPIPYKLGYPTQLYYGGGAAGLDIREVSEITVITHDFSIVEEDPYGGYYDVDRLSAGVAYLAEGQILPVGEEHVFEGYAHSTTTNVAAIELSFDQGATWLSFPIENADVTRWVWWNYKWTPTVPGAYTIAARMVGTDGLVMEQYNEIMFNVK